MLRLEASLLMVAVATSAALAQGNVLDERQKLMDQNQNGWRSLRPMLQGQQPVDQAAVRKVLETWSNNAKRIPTLFPDDTLGIKDTDALPAIKERREDFNALAAKLEADTRAAQTVSLTKDNLRAELMKAGQACNDCHDRFRKKK